MSTPVGYQILLSLSMQLFGLGLAGLSYRYIIEPPQMVSLGRQTLGKLYTKPASLRFGLLHWQTQPSFRHCTVVQTPLQTAGRSRDIGSSCSFALEASAGIGSLAIFLLVSVLLPSFAGQLLVC